MPSRTAPRPAARAEPRRRRPAAKADPHPLEIGGTAIARGRRETIELRIAELSTHTPITLPVQVVRGRAAGPTLFICAGLHGDEINGVEIIRRLLLLSALKRLRGTVIATPIVNVPGFIAQSRYLPDRRDLNRCFPGSGHGSLGSRLAHIFLNEIVAKCTHGIDLHTGAVHRDNFPQIRANIDDPEIERLSRAFGVPVIINAGYREGSLRQAAVDHGVRVLVYEAGEALRFDETSIRAGVSGVVRVMRALGMLPESRSRRAHPQSLIARSSQWVRAPISGILRAGVALGTHVRAGQRLGVLADPLGANEVMVVVEKPGILIGRTNLPLVHEGDALFHIARVEGTKVAAQALDAFEPELAYNRGATAELADEPPIV